jgi:ankyrin repeat protein/CRP-like cAMP-binding protein
MDRILEEVCKGIVHLKCMASEHWYQLNAEGIRLSAVIAASKTFRQALLELPLFEPLCKFNSFPISRLFCESESRALLEGCKIVEKKKNEVLYDQLQNGQWAGSWYLLLQGQVQVARVRNEEQLVACHATEGVVFGAYSSMQQVQAHHKGHAPPKLRRLSLAPTALDAQGIIVTASQPCVLIQMKTAGLEELYLGKTSVPSSLRKRISVMKKEMLEAEDRDLSSPVRPDNFLQFTQNKTSGSTVTEVDRRAVLNSFAMLDKIWTSISKGANTVPRASLDMMKDLLGEGGAQAFMDVFKPMYAENAPIEVRAEAFWYCWTHFLCETCLDEAQSINFSLMREERLDTGPRFDESTHVPPPLDLMPADSITIFEEQESFQDRAFALICRVFPWACADHRISSGFLEMPISMLETEFTRVTGSLTEPLQGESIRQYLKLVMVDFPFSISLENCREFCGLFNKKFEKSTKISYQEIVRQMIAFECNKGQLHVDSSRAFIHSCVNPNFVLVQWFTLLMRLVALYHFLVVPVRISFMPYPSFTSKWALYMDLPADVAVCVHVALSLNTAIKSEFGHWVTDRTKILRQSDLVCLVAVWPLDWFGFLCGLPHEQCLWLRVNKMLLFVSKISPKHVLYGSSQQQSGSKIIALLATIFFILHICACTWYWIGRIVPSFTPGPALSWLYADKSYVDTDVTFDRNAYLGMRPSSSTAQRYLSSLYWVSATITSNGVVGSVLPQNYVEIGWTICLMLLNMTLFRYVLGEISSLVMSADEAVVNAREHLERVTMFIAGKHFSPELRSEIRAHFKSVESGATMGQETILAGLSHGLRVELARFISWEALTKTVLFDDCSDQFLIDICVLLREVNFVPEEILYNEGDTSKEMFIVTRGVVEEGRGFQDEVTQQVLFNYGKGMQVGAFEFVFGLKHNLTARAFKQGAVGLVLNRDAYQETAKMHPADVDKVFRNGLKENKMNKGAATMRSTLTAQSRGSKGSKVSAGSKASSRRSAHSKASASTDGRSIKSGKSNKSAQSNKSAVNKSNELGDMKKAALANARAGAAKSMDEDLATTCRTAASEEGSVISSQRLHDDGDDRDSTAGSATAGKLEMIKQRDRKERIILLLTRVGQGDEERLMAMLKYGDVDLFVKDELKRTPLHVAASAGHYSLVKMLLEDKADVAAVDAMNNTPLNDAVRHKQDDVADLIRKSHASQKYKVAGAAMGVEMCVAAFAGDVEQIQRLIRNGVDPDVADYDGRTALHLSTCEGRVEVVTYLLSAKCNITCKDRFGGTPLEDAVRHNFNLSNASQVQALLRDHGASLMQSETNYTIKMCCAAWEGNLDVVKVLAENKVDVGMGDYDNRTPLHLSACAGHTSVIEYLLKQPSVVINAVDRFGGTPLEDAIRHGKGGAAALLHEAGGCRSGDGALKEVAIQMNFLKEKRFKTQREPKIAHMIKNSMESNAFRSIGTRLSDVISQQRSSVEPTVHRLAWALKGLSTRLIAKKGTIPTDDKAFFKAATHVLRLVSDVRETVLAGRSELLAHLNEEGTMADCVIWKKASTAFKKQAMQLDHHMNKLLLLARTTRKMMKHVVKVCQRQEFLKSQASSTAPNLVSPAYLDLRARAAQAGWNIRPGRTQEGGLKGRA